MNQPSEPLWNLIDAMCSGVVDDAQVEDLEMRLKDDATARDLFAQYCLLHADLRFSQSAQNAVDAARLNLERMSSAPGGCTQPTASSRRGFLNGIRVDSAGTIAASLIAAIILIVVSMNLVSWRDAGQNKTPSSIQGPRELVEQGSPLNSPAVEVPGFVAQLTRTFQARWNAGDQVPFVRQYLQAKHVLNLEEGIAELVFSGGTKVILEGPCHFTVGSRSDGLLQSGRLVVDNIDRKPGFQVKTPQATVIDLGADFGVEANHDGNTLVHVLDGVLQVAVQKTERTAARSERVMTNESLTIRTSGELTRGTSEPQRFARFVPPADDRLVELMSECLVTHYSFNDPLRLGRNSGLGRDGVVESVGSIAGVPSLGLGGDFGTDDLRAINVAVEDVSTFSPGGKDGRGLTVAAWVRTTCIDQRGNIFFAYNSDRENSDTRRDIVLLELEFGGLPNALVRDEAYGRELNLVHPKGIADGKWHHIALTLSPGTEKTLNLYVDGELTGTSSSRVINDVVLQRARVGRRLCENVDDDNDFQGAIDDLLILNRALKPSELRWLFNSTRPKWS